MNDDDQRGLRERQRDAPEHREVAVAVDPRRLEELARDPEEELALGGRCRRRSRRGSAPRAGTACSRRCAAASECSARELPDLVPDQVDAGSSSPRRQHHRREDEREQDVAAGEAEVRERERDDRARERDGDRGEQRRSRRCSTIQVKTGVSGGRRASRRRASTIGSPVKFHCHSRGMRRLSKTSPCGLNDALIEPDERVEREDREPGEEDEEERRS